SSGLRDAEDETHGEKEPARKGKMSVATKWYVRVTKPNHPRANKRGQVKRSVLVMEQAIGRYLLPDEEVHHLNRVMTDDFIGNLFLTTHSSHRQMEKNIKNRYEIALSKMNAEGGGI
ncbi:unnamed protein product, partial [marine sediment metagenome]